ncbi:MAG TPA: HAMP domain-containing sensor histidine kinase [Kineosporiaceae bacterium]|nr:HAMP domain-containing sensor histidine kinase [Kineosporiaceae bacterium]
MAEQPGTGPAPGPSRPAVRRRPRGLSALLQRSIVFGAALAMVLFGAPLAVAVKGLYRAQAFANLAGDAERTHASITTALIGSENSGPITVDLPAPRTEHASIAVYDAAGVRLGGSGPQRPESMVRNVLVTGLEDEVVVRDQIIVAVPVTQGDEAGGYVVRVSSPYGEVRARTYATWAVMAGLGFIVLVVVAGVGRARARRVARPLQSLAAAADALGHGDFSVRAVHAGIVEVDAVSDNLERTARRLGGMLERERSFSADASHQLRTPLTAVRLGLESALLTPGADLHTAVEDALVGLDRLEQTVLDLLALARDTGGARQRTDVGELAAELSGHWARALADVGRELVLDLEPDLPAAGVSQPALRTVLDVLLGNALTHGAGRVTVLVRATDATVVVQVADEGPGVVGDPVRIFARRSAEARGTGIGLALARSLVEADGGRLELTRVSPATFALLLPAYPEQTGEVPAVGGGLPEVPEAPRTAGDGAAGPGGDQLVRPGTTRTAGS